MFLKLDYYEIIKEDNSELDVINEDKEQMTNENVMEDKNKIFTEKKKEKVIIRDPKHSESKFLSGIMKTILWCIKFMIAFVAIGFVFTFISLVALLVLSFLFVKTGLVFAGTVMGIVAGILINFVVLEVLYNFIISKKSKKNKIAIILIISLVLAGLGLGTFWFGMTEFNYINTIENAEKTVFDVQMSDKLSINYWNNIEYIETDSENIKIEVIHPKYLDVYISKENEIIDVKYITKNEDIIQQIRDIINDINNKEIRNYIPTVYVYTSKGNIEKLIANRKKAYETQQREILENEIGDLKETIQKKEQEIENLKQEILDLKTRQ